MMQGEDSLDESKLDNHDVDHDMYTVVDVPLTGGPPWGFNLGGGSEFGRKLFVQKVRNCPRLAACYLSTTVFLVANNYMISCLASCDVLLLIPIDNSLKLIIKINSSF